MLAVAASPARAGATTASRREAMKAAGHEREQHVFQGCLEVTPPERGAYLDQACAGDPQLRARIERLLAADRRAKQETLSGLAACLVPQDLPDVIGTYRLLATLGEGGMAVVYAAEQLEPILRRVALKVVKLGMDSRQIVARFRTEQQALAAMDHPYVAKFFDAGQTVSGRPYFVMELVDGVPLLDYCRGQRLSIAQRLELMTLVCHAVQHAHQKSVIHRDLKPSNILVGTTSEGRPVPKIIDFGIAKAVGLEAAGGANGHTRADQSLGTPAYMSPEQAGRGGLDVDTRTDVYSLGVILYELLTGCLPVDPATLGHTEFLARLARGELDPARPSVRAGRGRELASDLDWIVMKALDVDRARRYETPLALAEDLERYARKEPVAARPPTASYCFRKFVRRNQLAVLGSGVLLASLAVFGSVSARQARVLAEQRRAAQVERDASEQVVRVLIELLETTNAVPQVKQPERALRTRLGDPAWCPRSQVLNAGR